MRIIVIHAQKFLRIANSVKRKANYNVKNAKIISIYSI